MTPLVDLVRKEAPSPGELFPIALVLILSPTHETNSPRFFFVSHKGSPPQKNQTPAVGLRASNRDPIPLLGYAGGGHCHCSSTNRRSVLPYLVLLCVSCGPSTSDNVLGPPSVLTDRVHTLFVPTDGSTNTSADVIGLETSVARQVRAFRLRNLCGLFFFLVWSSNS